MKKMHEESKKKEMFTFYKCHQEFSTEASLKTHFGTVWGAAGRKAGDGEMQVWKEGEQEEYSPGQEKLHRSEEHQRS